MKLQKLLSYVRRAVDDYSGRKEKIKESRSFFRKKRKDCKGQKNLAPKGILLWKYS